ncbi:MAG TPA: hypothetical protein VNJ08_17025 [Bacteriovoracaceae bacterium]|nr:hypothetical protein [Bacteriovoracaceae bacterium]
MKFFLALALIAGHASASGLKTVDLKGETTETQSPTASEKSGLTPEQNKELMKKVEDIKAKQAKSAKILEEMEKDE